MRWPVVLPAVLMAGWTLQQPAEALTIFGPIPYSSEADSPSAQGSRKHGEVSATSLGPGWDAFNQRNISAAEHIWSEALVSLEADGDATGVAQLLYNLSYVYEARGKLDDSIRALSRAISLAEPDVPIWLVAQQRLAAVYEAAGLHRDVEEVWIDLMDHFSGDTPAERSRKAGFLLNLASHYRTTGDYDESEKSYLRGIAILESVSGPHITLEAHFEGLALLYTKQRRYDEAVEVYGQRVQQIQLSTDGSTRVADALDEWARLLNLAGKVREAKEVTRRASELRSSK